MTFSPMIDGRRKKAIILEGELRQQDSARRTQAVRQAKALFGPTLATSKSDDTYLGKTRVVNSSNAADSIRTNSDVTSVTFGQRTNDLENKNVTLMGEAEVLCNVLESTISKGDITGVAIAIELSLKVIDEISVTKHEFAERTTHGSPKEAKSETAFGAFSDVVHKEKSLVALSSAAAADAPEQRFRGEVETYAFSPAHDALVCVVNNGGDKKMYRALQLDALPKVGDDVEITWDGNRGTVHDRTQLREATRGERVRKGS